MSPPHNPHDQLHARWLEFFAQRGHALPPSASLVPENDPTLLFTGAGMNQFKDLFLGKGTLPYRRAATVQRCLRQGDLENVGRTPRHCTFFEMLGHFSFGDYFKKEAVAWAWEFLTKELGLAPDRLRVSVYQDDAEALAAWLAVGLSRDRITRFDAKENFWPANAPEDGPNGPCGPCSEIFFDYGQAAELGDGSERCYDSGRFVEIWNTVFTQFDRRGPNDLAPLPQKNIDCGAGFERVLAALEGQYSVFGTTLFRPLIERIAEVTGKPYAFDPRGGLPPGEEARRTRRIADHVRAGTFLVADGVKPGNEGRGYVLRRILRRAIRDGVQLGLTEPFLSDVVPAVTAAMGAAYPHVVEAERVVREELRAEELRFRETYDRGSAYLEEELGKVRGKELPGEAAFRLYDTYGFPLDLAELILAERGMTVDRAGFDRAMEGQRAKARAGAKMKGDIFGGGPLDGLKVAGVPPTQFLGHDEHGGLTKAKGRVVGLVPVALAEGKPAEAAPPADYLMVLDRTPFYAESGGQVGDQGKIVSGAAEFRVTDTVKLGAYVAHRGSFQNGTIALGDEVTAEVDADRRNDIRRNHTATHLLHRVLKDVLGAHVSQQGSHVAPDRLRFDFSHGKPITEEQLAEIESRLNRWIVANEEARIEVLDLEAAKASGAVAMFGEKYEAKVRVLDVPGIDRVPEGSRELCGGTHVHRTGDIGSFRVTLETGIAAGVRRLEAVTGLEAARAGAADRQLLKSLSELLKARPEELGERVRALQTQLKDAQKTLEKGQADAAGREVERLAAERVEVGGVRVTLAALDGLDVKALRGVWDRLKRAGVNAAVLVGRAGDKAPVYVGVGEQAQARGVDASDLLKAVTAVLGGGGGGKADQAQGQGAEPAKIPAALAAVRARLEEKLAAASR
jgi:alanyl-tRNA synthetase